MKKLLSLFMVLAVASGTAILPAGCSRTAKKEDEALKSADAKKPELKNVNDEEAAKTQQIAEEYIDDIILAIKDDDYQRFSKNLIDELKQNITKENFKLMTQKFKEEKGDFVEKKFLTSLEKGYFKEYLWKAAFKKPDQKKAVSKDKLKDDTLIRLILAKVDDKYRVFAFSFQ